jgi:hypothetical protein
MFSTQCHFLLLYVMNYESHLKLNLIITKYTNQRRRPETLGFAAFMYKDCYVSFEHDVPK